jgi:hypothetical protein
MRPIVLVADTPLSVSACVCHVIPRQLLPTQAILLFLQFPDFTAR